jgi:hypothetical protein
MLNYLQTVNKYTIRKNLIFRLEIPDEKQIHNLPAELHINGRINSIPPFAASGGRDPALRPECIFG